ncbi:MAG: hypothetical protein H0V80_11160 [Acidobacteria bacterium]|nr:hypothetical protein [Acidobacteriota bacterium]
MPEFSVRADHVNVEEVMRQIRARVKEKRGADYTEQEIRELATVKLERFLDPQAVRSDLLEHYRRQRTITPLTGIEPAPPVYGFDAETIYASSRGAAGRLLRGLRKLFNPVLKLFFNPNPLIHVISMQSALNGYYSRSIDRISERFVQRDQLDGLNFEVLNNLVVELTRIGIENRNLKMRVESLNTRLDFAERRSRALEGVVEYKSGASPVSLTTLEAVEAAGEDADKAGRRRRRRRGRRRPGGDDQPGGGDEAAASDSGSERGADVPPVGAGVASELEHYQPAPSGADGPAADPAAGGSDPSAS